MDEEKLNETAPDGGTAAEDKAAANANDPNGAGEPADGADDRIAALEAEVATLKDQALRAVAEAENTRRRAERDKVDSSKYAIASFARDLLSVADNLGRAMESAPEAGTDEKLKAFIDGVQMTEKEILSVFAKANIEKIEALGERFDHNLHQAMFEVEDTGKPAGTVVQVLQPGYKLHDRLLRPAMVGVAKDKDETVPKTVNTVA